MAATFAAEGPCSSNVDRSQASAITFANSGPSTLAPIVMIWALFDFAARSAE